MTAEISDSGGQPMVLSGFSAFLEICRRWGLFAALSVVMFAYLLWSQYDQSTFIRERLMDELHAATETRIELAEEISSSTKLRQRMMDAMEANAKMLNDATQLMQRCVIRLEDSKQGATK